MTDSKDNEANSNPSKYDSTLGEIYQPTICIVSNSWNWLTRLHILWGELILAVEAIPVAAMLAAVST